MITITNISSLKQALLPYRKLGRSIGFVPTMGALHKGHISLVNECMSNTDVSVVSIFVNPTQFNNQTDLINYPRTLQCDSILLEETGCDILFAPSEKEMYPEPDLRKFDFGTLELVMEGKHRAGHFNGVAQIVSKLFDAVGPHKAYFGKKDFQQLAIISRLVKDYSYTIEIIGCPIIRETDGLAMSSRNVLLTENHRSAAPFIYQCLQGLRSEIKIYEIEEVEKRIEEKFSSHPLLQLEYFQIVDPLSLQRVKKGQPGKALVACIAVFAGNVRLIDNIDIIL